MRRALQSLRQSFRPEAWLGLLTFEDAEENALGRTYISNEKLEPQLKGECNTGDTDTGDTDKETDTAGSESSNTQ